jgi:hypothetical protein
MGPVVAGALQQLLQQLRAEPQLLQQLQAPASAVAPSPLPPPLDAVIDRFSQLSQELEEGFGGGGMPPRAPLANGAPLRGADRNPARLENFMRNVVDRGEESLDTADRLRSTLSLGSQVPLPYNGVGVTGVSGYGGAVGGGGGGFFANYRKGVISSPPPASTYTADSWLQKQAAVDTARATFHANEILRFPTSTAFWTNVFDNKLWAGDTAFAAECDQHLKCVKYLEISRGFPIAEEYNYLVMKGVKDGDIDFDELRTRPAALAGNMSAALHFMSKTDAISNVQHGINGGKPGTKARSEAAAPRQATTSKARAKPAAAGTAGSYCTTCRKDFAPGEHNFGACSKDAREAHAKTKASKGAKSL